MTQSNAGIAQPTILLILPERVFTGDVDEVADMAWEHTARSLGAEPYDNAKSQIPYLKAGNSIVAVNGRLF